MDIRVKMRKSGLLVDPATALVRVGESVRWRISSEMDLPLRWTIYFQNGTPLLWAQRVLSVPSGQEADVADAPQSPGDWKYGVRVENARTNLVLADDDPYLIVRP